MGWMNLALRTVKVISHRMNLFSRTVNPISGRVNLTCWTFKVIGCGNRVAKTTLKAVIHQIMSPTPHICAVSTSRERYESQLPKPANYPHKLTKAAGPLARRRSRLGRLQLHVRVTSAAVRSCHSVLVAAAAAPLPTAGA